VLGQDTQEVLEKMLPGLGADKLARLENAGIIERAKIKK
jgi:hypothetical protein